MGFRPAIKVIPEDQNEATRHGGMETADGRTTKERAVMSGRQRQSSKATENARHSESAYYEHLFGSQVATCLARYVVF